MSRIFKEVRSKRDYDEFYATLTPSWLEMNYTMECMLWDVTRYIVFNKDNIPVGTVELILYNPHKSSNLDDYFPFEKEKLIADNIGSIVEIESLSILPEHRKEGNIALIAYTLIEHCRKNKIKYGIGLMNPLLYLALRGTYQIPIKKLNNSNRKARYYPCLLDIEKIHNNIEKYQWLHEVCEQDNNYVLQGKTQLA